MRRWPLEKVRLIATDGSRKLGLGHIMRCVGFAQGPDKSGENFSTDYFTKNA